MHITRREFLFGLGTSLAAAPFNSFASDNSIQITRLEIKLPHANNFSGYKIAFLADLHLGPFLPDLWLENMFSILNEEAPDLILFGGDYINIPDNKPSKLMPHRNNSFDDMTLSEMINFSYLLLHDKIKTLTKRTKTIGVFGNHDRWIAPKKCIDCFQSAGSIFLNNQSYTESRGKQTLTIYGADDYWTGVPEAPLAKKTPTDISILLSHNPDHPAEIIKRNSVKFDLALCGHTHGGQIKLPVLGPLYKNIQAERFFEGLNLDGNTQIFTTRGIGLVGLPFRLNCPPEIAILTIMPG